MRTPPRGRTRPKPRPIVIDRLLIKRDGDGWLDRRRTHLHLVEVATKAVTRLTSGDADDREPDWSPDGTRIVFTSARHTDEDRTDETDLYVIDARAGAAPRRLTSTPTVERAASWSPDGRSIAFLQGTFVPVPMYGTQRVAVIPADGGAVRVLAPALDRPQTAPAVDGPGRRAAHRHRRRPPWRAAADRARRRRHHARRRRPAAGRVGPSGEGAPRHRPRRSDDAR
jgi:dipeptidyl aminopeptidase/acylaminoacyl peptidase